ncbi:MAG: 3-deoxy-7-phosphoheptulonate synthase, partial [Verrucomicrobia bacterium]|nr:3-deoxy-7-phosphoheptulonate synthase [Verrucomicrobiota bacterium]
MLRQTQNIHVREIKTLIPPRIMKDELPSGEKAAQTVIEGRDEIERIIRRQDSRLLVIAGPCSIHDTRSALEYAERLSKLRVEFKERMAIIMRVYFEKPRTSLGWKGLINDPHMNGSYDIDTGLRIARRLLLDMAEIGIPAATEFLDPIIPQYTADLVTWAAIGARTTES